MTTLNQQQKRAERKIHKTWEDVNCIAYDVRQYVYENKLSKMTTRKIFHIHEIDGELSFLNNHFEYLVQTMDVEELVHKAVRFRVTVKKLLEDIEKEIAEQQ